MFLQKNRACFNLTSMGSIKTADVRLKDLKCLGENYHNCYKSFALVLDYYKKKKVENVCTCV